MFEVSVRRQGTFKRVATTDTLKDAFKVGRLKVENTAAASFKVNPIGNPESVSTPARRFLSPKEFYESKKEAGVFIQRREKRIKTAGEKREITYRGLFTQKSKKARRGLFKL